jgi:glycosyltransferase involved in cell wall biosynthesis
MNLLFLSRWFPYPPDNGSKLRIYHLVRGLAQHHRVTLLSFADRPDAIANAPELASLCYEVQTVPWKDFKPSSRRACMGFVSPRPRWLVDTFSEGMAGCVAQVVAQGGLDMAIVSELPMTNYVRLLQGTPALLEDCELGVFYEQFAHGALPLHCLRHGLTWAKMRTYLARLLPHFQACTVVSHQERQLLSAAVPGYRRVEIIPNCINLPDYAPVRGQPWPDTLIFTGSFTYDVNYEAMVWFLKEVYPLIRQQAPQTHLTITGDHANLPLPKTQNITLTGFVDDVQSLLASSWLSVVPIKQGGGTRLKILEAMALHTPVVSTSKGAEGLAAEHEVHLLIADTPQAFALAVLRLLREPDLRRRLADAAYQMVRDNYDWAVVMPRFLELVERVSHASP